MVQSASTGDHDSLLMYEQHMAPARACVCMHPMQSESLSAGPPPGAAAQLVQQVSKWVWTVAAQCVAYWLAVALALLKPAVEIQHHQCKGLCLSASEQQLNGFCARQHTMVWYPVGTVVPRTL